MLVIASALIIASGLLFNAYDGAAGQATSCILYSGLMIALVLLRRPSDAFWRRVAPVLLLALAALAWGVIATVSVSNGLPDYTPGKLVAYIGALAALLAGAVLAWQGRSRRRLIDLMMAANTVFVSAGLAMFWFGADGYFSLWTTERLGRFQGTIGNVNVTSVVAACFALWAGHRLLTLLRDRSYVSLREVLRRTLYAAAFLVNVLAVVLTASRLTNVVLTAELMVAALLFYVYRRMSVRAWATRVVVPAAALLLIASRFSGRLTERFGALPEGWSVRTQMWGHYSELAGAAPLFGYGLGAFPMVNAQYLTDPHFATATWAVNSPHNVLLQMLLGAGLPYCLLILAAVAVGTAQTLRTMRDHWGGEDIAILGMIALILTSAMIDVVLDMPATVGLTMFLTGLLWGHVPERIEAGIARAGTQPPVHERPVRA